MPSLKDLKNRIASVKATQKITKAMKMVAAAKLRRAQEAAEAARPYSQRMAAVLSNIAQAVGADDSAPRLMTGTGKDDTHLLVVCTAERGLCGGFNSQIARHARDHVRKLLAQGKTVKIICVGKKGFDILRREFASLIIDRVDLREVKKIGFENADRIGHKVIELFDNGEFDVCTLFYSEFKSVISQIPTAQQLIPASAGEAVAEGASAIYEYEPDAAAILSDLIPRNISVQIFRALLENVAGEMGAKMSAMDNATRNAGEMINKLTLNYNRQRQAQITKELIEIISGAEAL
ncbi:F0F1 ATP synthase subunit gamma [Sinorhizobium medicae]|jgi:F-type H+-transporting ATPase subunit gamma|uniref:ATP synthase gamma chain n=2 Tax=Sinorhizobium medicae TaxID=110321 RepID=ATPG_SINMW|nr:F0F1 ATP synthase subunit gamma [Sinorhizobium medicae]A6UDM2.1 RecName: Full=ATP synthase gamma chain; AltName: Full=ATP synthase F1 sector gamma subunit; AltName: Full=F-ATPase gamma subunit [Sinorhizobium medicae WSM419]ABR61752.1 ATP synthase F1, gamma subunit [Sinorhizobium medicae WSM419]MBO1941365.1 F0F1 ATP synthase subunit gamma [Sinorhizobium medicae]MBO1964612.1 F0F1 ATP synthase subunit gamma [Sinorhizobium medicae]MDX0404637.1 F0F1 ATP synthase subunit gamma [Sinorhizobium medi